jgi:hypothetical protein
MRAHAWAVVDGGEINLQSISGTPRGAMMTWLVATKGHPIDTYATDPVVLAEFGRWRSTAKLQRVTIVLQSSLATDDPAATWAG